MTGKQLKNSILQWAIQGKLVPQDPNDEPASVLLERIREEKAKLVKEKKIKKDKNESIIYRGEDNSYYEKFVATGEVKCIDEEIPFQIPDTWCWARLGHIVVVNPRNRADDSSEAGYIPMTYIDGGYVNCFHFDIRKWGEVKTGLTHLADGDVAFAKITPCFQNRKSMVLSGLPNGIAGGTTELNVLRTYGDTICREYLLYFVKTHYFIVEASFKGTAGQQRVRTGYTENKLIPIPPISEQYRIVQKIIDVMPLTEKYEISKSNLDFLNLTINNQLRKSILQEAIQGRLVPQNLEDEPASELLRRIHDEKLRLVKEGKLNKSALTDSVIFRGDDNKYYEQVGKDIKEITEEIGFDLPNGWIWCRLKDVCSIFTGATFRKEEASTIRQGVRILRGGNILPFELKIKDDDIFLAKGKIKVDILLKENDILTPAVTSLENIGKMARVDRDMPDTTVGGFVFIIRLYLINRRFSKYILYLLSSPFMIDFMKSITNKSGQAFYNIGKERLSTALLPIPPLTEQHRIVAQIEKLFEQLK